MKEYIADMRAWISQYRAIYGKEPTSFQMCQRIRRTWPNDNEEFHERIFRAVMYSKSARGGEARAKKLSPARRSEIAKLAAESRWKKVHSV